MPARWRFGRDMNRVSRRILLLLFGCLIGFAMGHIYYTRQSCDPAKVVFTRMLFTLSGDSGVSISEIIRERGPKIRIFELEINADIRAYPCRWYHFRWGQ